MITPMKRFHIPRPARQLGWTSLLAIMLIILISASDAHVGAAGVAVLVKDINPGPADGLMDAFTVPGMLASARGQLFFIANNGTDGTALWKSDGTEAGTTPITGFQPLSPLINVNDTLFFAAEGDAGGYELWKSDGTAAGTTLVADINPGSAASFPEWLTNVNGTLFFLARDAGGVGLWKSDGSAAGTILLKRSLSSPNGLYNVNGTLFYVADEQGGFGNGLWRSDGTPEGTILLQTFATIPPPPQGSIGSLTAVGQQLFFVAYNSGRGYELWKSDGTVSGTTRVSDNGPQTTTFYGLWFLQNVNGTLFALVDQSQQNTALWKSDGTAAGTVKIKQFDPFTSAADITSINTMANVSGKLVFALYPASGPGSRGGAIWASDGTTAGTTVIKDQLVHRLSSVVACGKLYFSASGSPTGWELWQSDGTAAGTIQVQDIAPGPADSNPMQITSVARQLFFSANDGTSGRELWALPITHTTAAKPTPAIPLPHQIFLPHAQIDASC